MLGVWPTQHWRGRRVKDACEDSNLRKVEKTRLLLWKVLWRKEAEEEISFTLEGHSGILEYKYPAADSRTK